MKTYLGIGSNIGDRVEKIEFAIGELKKLFKKDSFRVSPVYENAALLPEHAPPEWNMPFLNVVVAGDTTLTPQKLLAAVKNIEEKAGRPKNYEKWAPRALDIDILLFGDQRVAEKDLKIPHPEMTKRPFVLDPLKDLAPSLEIGKGKSTVLSLARKAANRLPLLMGILNATPDSFSGDGVLHTKLELQKFFKDWPSSGFQILDIGAESTRPGATAVSAEEELSRFQRIFGELSPLLDDRELKPKISIDSRRPKVLAKLLKYGVDIINDVSGLADPEMLSLIKNSDSDYVLMHSLSVPADPKQILADAADPTLEIYRWFESKLEVLQKNKISLDRIIIDPGIGFGKSAPQSLEILKNIEKLQKLGCRLLVGHSRKSFIGKITKSAARDRDAETLGIAFFLLTKGIDILRIHNSTMHARSFLAWNSLLS